MRNIWSFSPLFLSNSEKNVLVLRKVGLLFNFWMIRFTIMSKKHSCEFHHSKIEKKTQFPQKIYKLSKTSWPKLIYFSLNLRERGEKKTKYFAPQLSDINRVLNGARVPENYKSLFHLLYAEIFCSESYRNFCKYTS